MCAHVCTSSSSVTEEVCTCIYLHVLRIQSKGLGPGGAYIPQSLDTCSIRMPQRGSIMEQKCAGADKYVEIAEKSEYTAISAFPLFIY